MLEIGEKIPLSIELKDNENNIINLSRFLGKYLVIYFYPKDDTPGCTTEACEFRDLYDQMRSLNVELIGISKDNSKSHDKFKSKHNLNFILLSDEEHKLQEAFGVWGEKTMYGKKYLGAQRATFLINKEGVILYKWTEVKPLGHAEEVYSKLKEITSINYKL